jgi:hypothetical protein
MYNRYANLGGRAMHKRLLLILLIAIFRPALRKS